MRSTGIQRIQFEITVPELYFSFFFFCIDLHGKLTGFCEREKELSTPSSFSRVAYVFLCVADICVDAGGHGGRRGHKNPWSWKWCSLLSTTESFLKLCGVWFVCLFVCNKSLTLKPALTWNSAEIHQLLPRLKEFTVRLHLLEVFTFLDYIY